MLELTTASFKPLDVVLLELSSSNEDSNCSKTSEVGALGIGMSISFRYGFRANWLLG